MSNTSLAFPDENAAHSPWLKKQNAIYDDWVKGNQNYTKLAKKHGISRADAIKAVESVHEYVKASGTFKEVAKQRLAEMDHHYNMLVEEAHNAVYELKNDDKWDKVPAALKIIADIESQRYSALQKAGAFEDYEIGDMLAESERKIEAITTLLKTVIQQFPETKQMIMSGIKDIQDPNRLPEPDVIEGKAL